MQLPTAFQHTYSLYHSSLSPPNAICFVAHYWVCVIRSLNLMVPQIPHFFMSFLIHCFTEMSCVCPQPGPVLTTNLKCHCGLQGYILLSMIDGYQCLRGTCCLHLEDPDHNMHLHYLSSFRYSIFTCIVQDHPSIIKVPQAITSKWEVITAFNVADVFHWSIAFHFLQPLSTLMHFTHLCLSFKNSLII